jgi:hypothetical protein
MVFLLTLTHGPVSPLLTVGFGLASSSYHFILAADTDAWVSHYYFRMKLASLKY